MTQLIGPFLLFVYFSFRNLIGRFDIDLSVFDVDWEVVLSSIEGGIIVGSCVLSTFFVDIFSLGEFSSGS